VRTSLYPLPGNQQKAGHLVIAKQLAGLCILYSRLSESDQRHIAFLRSDLAKGSLKRIQNAWPDFQTVSEALTGSAS
jgi:hypothetical protein